MSSIPATHVIQVTNVAPAATLEQMKELFSFLGRIKNIKMYPSESCIIQPQSKVCYVEYNEKWSVGVAQHLTNTVFIDRALIVVPIADEGIPSESTALALTNPSSALPGLVSSGPNALINEISGVDGSLVITTIDPKLTALGLPQYPPLPANLDPVKIEEIRRTVTVGNLDPSVSADSLLKYFNQIGEVKFLRMSGDGIDTVKFAFVEFTDQSSVPKALQYNSITYEGRPMLINHSTNAIVKPLPRSEAAQKEIEEAMKRVREAQSLISAVIEPEIPEREKSRRHKSHSRSRSRGRSISASRSRRKRSRSRSKRSRSRSKRSRSRSKRSRSHSKRSRSRTKRSTSRRRSHDHRVSRTPPKHSKRRSRSRSRDRRKVSPYHKKGRSRSVSRGKKINPQYKRGRSRSRSRGRKKVSPVYKKGKSRSRSRDRNKKHRSKSRSLSKSKSSSRKSKSSKHKDESQECERTSKEKVEKEFNKDLKSKSNTDKDSESSDLYGPSIPVPQIDTSSKEYSKSPVKRHKYRSSKSRSRSPVRHNKYHSSKSRSRSPSSRKRELNKRTWSRSPSKELSSHRNKSRSVSKHRSRSRSHRRSRSRSKGSSRKKQFSPKHNFRSNSRSITPSAKRSSRYSASRQVRSERHSTSSQKRSLSPRKKSETPKRESYIPVLHLKSLKSESRSPTPENSSVQNSPVRTYMSPKSPGRLSLSPESIMLKEKEKQYLEEKEKLAALFASSDEGDNVDQFSPNVGMDEVNNLQMVIGDHSPYIPENYNSGYNSNDMDLGSD